MFGAYSSEDVLRPFIPVCDIQVQELCSQTVWKVSNTKALGCHI